MLIQFLVSSISLRKLSKKIEKKEKRDREDKKIILVTVQLLIEYSKIKFNSYLNKYTQKLLDIMLMLIIKKCRLRSKQVMGLSPIK